MPPKNIAAVRNRQCGYIVRMRNAMIGAIAGAAGTMALDIASYGDMAVRGRQSSNMPAEVVRRLAEKAGVEPLAKPDDAVDAKTKNRRSALGALSGYGVGLAIGTLYGATRPLTNRLPWAAAALGVGIAAMLATDVPAARLGATDLRQWSAGSWLSDIIPHLAFGFTTVLVASALAASND